MPLPSVCNHQVRPCPKDESFRPNKMENKTDSPKGRSGSSTHKELRPDIKWHLFSQPLYFLSQSTIHEGSHALTVMMLGHTVTHFKPYPHTYMDGNGQRRFVITGTTEFGDKEGTVPPRDVALIAATPTLLDLALFSATDFALAQTGTSSLASPFLYFAGMVWPWMDFTLNINLVSPHSDVGNWSRQWGLAPYGVLIAGDCLAALGLWRLLDQGIRTLFTDFPNTSSSSIHVLPRVEKKHAGLVMEGSF
jgi:hypothetical protein